MGRRTGGRGLVLGVSMLALVGYGCTPETVTPTPPPTTAASATPTETAQEREERLAYEAAEESYRAVRKEFARVTASGGASAATRDMKQYSAGPYLKELTQIVQAYKKVDYRTRGEEKIGYIRRNGYSQNSLLLEVCEDDSRVDLYNSDGKKISTSNILVLDLEAREVDGVWKIWGGQGKEVNSC